MTTTEVIKVLIPTIVRNKGKHQQNEVSGFSCTGLICIGCPFEEDNTSCTHNITRFLTSINLQNFDQLDVNSYKQSNPEWFI